MLFSGANVFSGYWNNAGATAEAIDADGWFHSGDLGEIDDDGFVRITGRKKELIVTAAGKNVAPAVLEDRLRANWLVSQCMVVGDGQPFISALVTIDPEAFPAWLEAARQAGRTRPSRDLVDDADAATPRSRRPSTTRTRRSRTPRRSRSSGSSPVDWTEEGGQITPSLKLKRNVVMKEFADDVAALYA